MRKILTLCINLLLLIISDAVPLQLIAGDRRVVKKDGATHTISKYYVVPNDFDPNNVINSTEASQTMLRMNSLYSKSMDANTASGDQVSEKKAEAANDQTNENNTDVNNTEVNSRSGLNDAQVKVATQANDNISKSTESVSTGQSLDHEDFGNLQVEPITNSININSSDTINEINAYNSSEALQNGATLIVKNATQTLERDELDELILTKFGIAVQERSVQNLESFRKLIKLTVDRISDNDELLAKIERLSLLLNIFTNLYEAAQLQKPIESMIDSIIDILQIPFFQKSNTSKSQTDVSGDYDKDCLRKCGLKRSKSQRDSNGNYLSETEGLEASDNLELEKLELKRRHKGESDENWVNTSVPISNQVTFSNQPTNILRSQLLVPNNLNVGVPDGYNVRSSILTPTLNHVTHNNDNQEDPKLNQIIADSPETGENTDDQPSTFESILTDDLPWHIEDKTTDNLPWHIEDKTTDNLPWHIEDKTTNNLPWHIEDKSTHQHPLTIEHRTTHTLPWTIEDTGTKNVPWKVEKRADPNWTIENKVGLSPIFSLYQSRDPNVITHGGENLLHPNQPMTGTVHSIKHGVKTPYHIYTYVINPASSLYQISNSDNIVKVKSRQPNDNLGIKLYGLPSSHGGNKIVYTNKPSTSDNGSQFSLSKPTIDISSQTSNSQLKHTNYVSYDTSNEVNPSTLFSETLQDDYQPKYLVGHVLETNKKPALLQSNTLPLDSQTNSDQENDEPQVPEVGSDPGVLLPNVPSNLFESRLSNEPVSTAISDTSDVNPDIGDTKPNPYNPKINLNYMEQTNSHPGLISKTSSHSEYTNLPGEYDEPIYGDQTHQHPGLISSSNSKYTNVADDFDEPNPVYGGQTLKYPGFISKASAHSKYTNLPNDYNNPIPDYGQHTETHPGLITKVNHYPEYSHVDYYEKPIPVYGKEIHKYPGFLSKASSHSEYTNLPGEYDEPIYGDQTHQHPGLISSSASSNSKYTNVADDFDEPNPVYGGQTLKYPGFISKASAHSKYTNLPNDYNNPIPDYGQHTETHPGLITKVNHYPEYSHVDKPIPVYGEEIHKHPGFLSKASSHSEYTNLPGEYDEPIYGDQTHQHPGLISSSASSNSKYTNVADDFDEPNPVYGGQTLKYPGFISKASAHSKYTNLPNDYNNPIPDYGQHTETHPGLITKVNHYPEYSHVDKPIPVYGKEIHKHPGFLSKASSHSEYTNLPGEYDEPIYGDQTHQHPGLISSSASSNSKYTNVADDFDEPNSVYGGQTLKYPGFISKASAHSKYTNLPNDYNNPIPDYGQHTETHPGLITKVNHYPEYSHVDYYDKPIPVYGEEIHKHPGFLSKASSHSEYTIPKDYNNPTDDYKEDTDRHIKTPVNGGPIENEDNLQVSYHPYGHTVNIIQPSLITHLQGNQPTGLNYLKHLKLKLAPTYRLFTLHNLLKLHDVVIKTIEVIGDEPDVYNNRGLINLSKIINIILKLAEHLQGPEGSIEWYEKIFYNTQKNRHPLENYVYNLIRQRWLHELMLVLHKNDFNFNILLNPRILSFLGSLQFPHYVLNFIEREEYKQHNFDAPEVFDQMFTTQHGLQDKFATHTYDDLLEEIPEDLENYVTNKVINSYKRPNAGIVLSIAGVEAEPDANAIINILQKYLHNKSFIEKQENVIIRDNKVEMLNQIILFLREKGYGATTIADLIRKLYTAVISTEGKGCQTHHTNFAKNMYDVILPVLRRSGR